MFERFCHNSSTDGKPWIAISADDMGAAFVVIPDDPTDPDNWLYTKSLIVDAGANQIIGMPFSWWFNKTFLLLCN